MASRAGDFASPLASGSWTNGETLVRAEACWGLMVALQQGAGHKTKSFRKDLQIPAKEFGAGLTRAVRFDLSSSRAGFLVVA